MGRINAYQTDTLDEAAFLCTRGAVIVHYSTKNAPINITRRTGVKSIYCFVLDNVDPVAVKKYKDHEARANIRHFMTVRRRIEKLFK